MRYESRDEAPLAQHMRDLVTDRRNAEGPLNSADAVLTFYAAGQCATDMFIEYELSRTRRTSRAQLERHARVALAKAP